MADFEIIRNIFGYPDYLYNCSGKTVEEWNATGTKWPTISVILLFSACISIFLYSICLHAMWKLRLFKMSCYRLMFALGFADIFTIVHNSLIPSVVTHYGYVFCTNPFWMYIYGASLMTSWAATSFLYVLLALNRMFAIIGFNKLKRFFDGLGGWFWLIPTFVYAFVTGIICKPLPFSSRIMAATFIPFIEEDFPKESYLYDNPAHAVNNIMVTIALVICYTVILRCLSVKSKEHSCKFEIKIVIQALLISTPTCIACVLCVYLQYMPAPSFLIYTTTICWIIATGIASFIYLTINQDIRGYVFKGTRFAPTRNSVASVSRSYNLSKATSKQTMQTPSGFTDDA